MPPSSSLNESVGAQHPRDRIRGGEKISAASGDAGRFVLASMHSNPLGTPLAKVWEALRCDGAVGIVEFQVGFSTSDLTTGARKWRRKPQSSHEPSHNTL